MTRRDRVLKSLSFEKSRAIDLGGMLSTGINCFTYPRLAEKLGLPSRRPKIIDEQQMLALPEADVLDALDCDVAAVYLDLWTNAFDDSRDWTEYNFNGRLDSLVMNAEQFSINDDQSIYCLKNGRTLKMVPSSYVFDDVEGDEQTDIMSGDLMKEDLSLIEEELKSLLLSAERIESIAEYCRKARESTDRAIMFNGLSMGLKFRKGMAYWSMLCLTDPDHVMSVHELITAHYLKNLNALIPAIAPYIDIIMTNSDDQGTQNATILPPEVFRSLYVPYYRRVNDCLHELAPELKTFLHSCGAIYPIIDDIIDAGFDVLNPVQWNAGSHSFREWKNKARGRITLWGGGINAQKTLPLGNLDEIAAETEEICSCLNEDGGFVFNSIHNILAEIEPEKIITMYRTAQQTLS